LVLHPLLLTRLLEQLFLHVKDVLLKPAQVAALKLRES
jgi:hypothetical protein